MAALDQHDHRLVRLFPENIHGDPGGRGRFFAVAEAVHHRDQCPVGEGLHQGQIAGDGLAGNRLRGHAPLQEGLAMKRGRAHSTHPLPHGYPGSLANL